MKNNGCEFIHYVIISQSQLKIRKMDPELGGGKQSSSALQLPLVSVSINKFKWRRFGFLVNAVSSILIPQQYFVSKCERTIPDQCLSTYVLM
jgi:hypothetical protein